jgi:hypothetical protein
MGGGHINVEDDIPHFAFPSGVLAVQVRAAAFTLFAHNEKTRKATRTDLRALQEGTREGGQAPCMVTPDEPCMRETSTQLSS